MSVASETTYTGPLIANGVTTAFSWTFLAMSADEIEVYGLDADGAEVTLPDFTAALSGTAPSAGTVTFDTAPDDGTRVWIASAPDFKQEIGFEDGSRWLAGPVNEANDRAAIRTLALKRDADRSVKLPIGEAGIELPPGSGPTLYTSVNTLAGIAGDITIAADRADDIEAVAGVVSDVTTVAGIYGDVTTVADISANVTTVAGVSGNVTTVAGISGNVTTVAGVAASVSTLAGISGNITTVAGISANVTTVAGASAAVTTVATDITSVNTAATNIAAIIAAPSEAAAAAVSAAAAATTATGLGSLSSLLPSYTKAQAHTAPPSARTETKGYVTDTIASALTGIWIVTHADGTASFEGYLTTLQVRFSTALVGRTVEIYVMRDQGGGSYKVIYASGTKAAASAGVNTISFATGDNMVFSAGDVMGIWCSATTNADGIAYSTVSSGVTAIRRNSGSQSRLTVNSNYGGAYTTATTTRPQFAVTITSTTFLLTSDWLGAANGVPASDTTARSTPASTLFGGGDTLSTSDATMSQEGGKICFRENGAVTTDAYPQETTGTTATYAASTATAKIYYNATNLGLSKAGYLRELTIAAGSNIPASCKIQIALFRPRSALPTAGASTVICDPVSAIGEFDLSAYGASTAAPEIRIPLRNFRCEQHDVLVIKGPNGFGTFFGQGTGYSNDWEASATVTGTTLADLVASPVTFTVNATNRRWLRSTVIVDASPLANTNGPAAAVITDTNGFIPNDLGRQPDLPLRNKDIVLSGSSISTPGGGGAAATTNGHMSLVIPLLQCKATNVSVGGSTVQWNPSVATGFTTEPLTIGATAAELTARYGGSFAQYSYENKLLGHGYYGFVLHDAINDTNSSPSLGGVGTWADAQGPASNPNTYYGVMSRMIEAIFTENASARIWLQTPFHRWATYSVAGVYPTEQTNREQYRAAAYDLAERYGLAGVIDYMQFVPCNSINVKNGNGLQDTIHPTEAMKAYAAQVAYNVLNKG